MREDSAVYCKYVLSVLVIWRQVEMSILFLLQFTFGIVKIVLQQNTGKKKEHQNILKTYSNR